MCLAVDNVSHCGDKYQWRYCVICYNYCNTHLSSPSPHYLRGLFYHLHPKIIAEWPEGIRLRFQITELGHCDDLPPGQLVGRGAGRPEPLLECFCTPVSATSRLGPVAGDASHHPVAWRASHVYLTWVCHTERRKKKTLGTIQDMGYL